MSNRLDVAVAGDCAGKLIGTVSCDEGKAGVVGAGIMVKGECRGKPWMKMAATGDNGFFVVEIPYAPTGTIEVIASSADGTGTSTVRADDLSLGLTPRPEGCRLPLDGEWEFAADPPEGGPQAWAGLDWHPVAVPSNYEMEGLTTSTGAAALRRSVLVPLEWSGRRVLLRAEAIYSHAEVWCNGQRVGSHEGGATPFELDLTDAVRPGEGNVVAIQVTERSRSAGIDNMSVYAFFEIAGIWRPIELFCTDPVHMARGTWTTTFDDAYRDGTLHLDVTVANSSGTAAHAEVCAELCEPGGLLVAALSGTVEVGAWERDILRLSVTVPDVLQWSAELPNLYDVSVTLGVPGQPGAVVRERVGFRQVEIHGREFRINGRSERLFGACLHTADPLMGRAITEGRARQDLELVKGANLNAIRTSHYPPHPATPVLADEIGIYIEDEGPSCWAEGSEDLRNAPMYTSIVCQYMERDRNRASVVYWSTCNESQYGIMFQLAHRYAQRFDPTRPVGGSYAPEDMDNDVYVVHHPPNTAAHIAETSRMARPVFYDECLTVLHGWGDLAQSLELDPGMHDYWGTGIRDIRDQLVKSENQVGSMIWAWVDDAFAVPGRGVCCWRRDLQPTRYSEALYKMPGRGYQGDCVWGVVDGWRRSRPEWFLARKIYSPVRIPVDRVEAPPPGEPIRLPVENHFCFADLGLYRFEWRLGASSGSVVLSVPPRGSGTLAIPVESRAGDSLEVRLVRPGADGCIDSFEVAIGPAPRLEWVLRDPARVVREEGRYLSGARAYLLRGQATEWAMDETSGEAMWALSRNEQVLNLGPHLHLLRSDAPLATYPRGWRLTGSTAGAGCVDWRGEYADGFAGGFTIRMDRVGQVQIGYSFERTGDDLWVREIGLRFELPLAFDTLEWDRDAEHTCYPDDHIGRPRGVARAHPASPQSVPPGDRPFALDDHAWGCNDFRSTKRRIRSACLRNPEGRGLVVVSDGSQAVRCTVGAQDISLKVLDFTGGAGAPGQWSVNGFHYGPGRLVRQGDVLSGTVRIRLE